MTSTPVNELNQRTRRAEVVSIGDEMTCGSRLDTNAQWLSQRLGDLGIEVAFHSTVGDTLQDNVDVFRIATSRADIVVSTGGLGPTRDDLTRESLAAVVDRPLELSAEALRHIESLFARRKREMPDRNQVQAMFPAGSCEIFNPQGTAPGIDLGVVRDDGSISRVFALPGVPAEMKRMFQDTVSARILDAIGRRSRISQHVMKLFGIGESDMEQRLGDMISRSREPRVGITVSAATISLRITAMSESDEQCLAMIENTREEILARAGEFYFGDGEDFEQHHAIDTMLREREQSLLVVELGNAAPLGDWFAGLGETPSYRGGISLAVADDLLRLSGGTQLEAAIDSIRSRFSADWLLMVDSYPALHDAEDSPLPASEVKFKVFDSDGRCYPVTSVLGGHPAIVHARIGKAAMQWFRKVLKREFKKIA